MRRRGPHGDRARVRRPRMHARAARLPPSPAPTFQPPHPHPAAAAAARAAPGGGRDLLAAANRRRNNNWKNACPRGVGFGGVNAVAFPNLGLLAGTATLFNNGAAARGPRRAPRADGACAGGATRPRPPPAAPRCAPRPPPPLAAPPPPPAARAPLRPSNAGFALGGNSPLHGALRCPGGLVPAFGRLKCAFVAPFVPGAGVQPYFTPAGAGGPCLGGGGWGAAAPGAGVAPAISRSDAAAVSNANYADAVASAMSQAFGGPAYASARRRRRARRGAAACCRLLGAGACQTGPPKPPRAHRRPPPPPLPPPLHPAVGKAKAQSFSNNAYAAADAVAQAMCRRGRGHVRGRRQHGLGPATAITNAVAHLRRRPRLGRGARRRPDAVRPRDRGRRRCR